MSDTKWKDTLENAEETYQIVTGHWKNLRKTVLKDREIPGSYEANKYDKDPFSAGFEMFGVKCCVRYKHDLVRGRVEYCVLVPRGEAGREKAVVVGDAWEVEGCGTIRRMSELDKASEEPVRWADSDYERFHTYQLATLAKKMVTSYFGLPAEQK